MAETENSSYAQLLQKIVTHEGVRWSQFGQEERKLLLDYMNWLATTIPSTLSNSKDQLAFWINAHNACVMKLILNHWPIENAMDIPGFRDQLKCNIGGTEHSLVELESGILRPLFREPRAHFALWWGVRGGPRLLPVPYEGKKIDQLLEERTKHFVTDSNFLRIEEIKSDKKTKNVVKISPLFDWFKYDFGKRQSDFLLFIRKNVDKTLAKKIPTRISDVSFLAFDWTVDNVP